MAETSDYIMDKDVKIPSRLLGLPVTTRQLLIDIGPVPWFPFKGASGAMTLEHGDVRFPFREEIEYVVCTELK